MKMASLDQPALFDTQGNYELLASLATGNYTQGKAWVAKLRFLNARVHPRMRPPTPSTRSRDRRGRYKTLDASFDNTSSLVNSFCVSR